MHAYVEVPLKDIICRNSALKCHNIHITKSNSTFMLLSVITSRRWELVKDALIKKKTNNTNKTLNSSMIEKACWIDVNQQWCSFMVFPHQCGEFHRRIICGFLQYSHSAYPPKNQGCVIL